MIEGNQTTTSPFKLKGKTILVTGASSGIGRTVALECAKMGARLIITGRNPENLRQTFEELEGENHEYVIADLTLEDDLKTLQTSLSDLNGAVLCAGISDSALIQFSSLKKFKKNFDTNFFSQTELIRLLVKGKKFGNESSIIVISSVAAFSYELGNGIYGAGKAALSTWIRYAARELGPKGIRLNCICPGVVETPLIHDGAISQTQYEENKKRYPLGRFGRQEDIAYAVIFLLSNASEWITGIDLVIDGGYTLT